MDEFQKSVFLPDKKFRDNYASIFEKWTGKDAHEDYEEKQLYWVLLTEFVYR